VWAALPALLQISSATRIEEEVAMSAPSFFQSAGLRKSTLLGEKRRNNGSDMGKRVKTRKGKLVRRGEHDARLGRVVQVQKRG